MKRWAAILLGCVVGMVAMTGVAAAGTLQLSYPDGKTAELSATPGQVMWIPAESHAAVNTGSTEFTALVVELKPLPAYDEGE